MIGPQRSLAPLVIIIAVQAMVACSSTAPRDATQ